MPKRRGMLRWWIIGLVMLGTILNYLTRALLGATAPVMLPELGITTEQYAWINSAFQIGIMAQALAGYFLDSVGLRVGLAICTAAWAIIAGAHAFAANWQVLAGLRGAMGLAEGSAQPGGLKVVSEWFPAKERGLAGGIYNIGASFGSMLAPPLILLATLWFGSWHAAFLMTGALGLGWVLLWLFYYRPLREHPSMTAEEREYVLSGQEHATVRPTRAPLLSFLKRRNVWGIAIPRFLADPTWSTLTAWMPLYLATERGFDLKAIALTAWLPFVTADLGCLFGPALATWMQRRGISLLNGRRIAFTIGALMMTSMMFVGQVESPYAAIALLSIGGFAHQTLSISNITLAADLFPSHEVGTVGGIAGTFANFGILLFTLALGVLVPQYGYGPFFIALGVFDLFAAVWLWTVVRDPLLGTKTA